DRGGTLIVEYVHAREEVPFICPASTWQVNCSGKVAWTLCHEAGLQRDNMAGSRGRYTRQVHADREIDERRHGEINRIADDQRSDRDLDEGPSAKRQRAVAVDDDSCVGVS